VSRYLRVRQFRSTCALGEVGQIQVAHFHIAESRSEPVHFT